MTTFATTPGRVMRRLIAAVAVAVTPLLAGASPALAAATNGSILSVVAGNGSYQLVPGGPALSSGIDPAGSVAADNHGGYFVASAWDNAVAKVDAQGQLTILAGQPGSWGSPTPGPGTQSMLASPNSVAADGQGNAYIADWNEVLKVSTTGELSVLAGDPSASWSGTVTSGPALTTAIRAGDVVATPDGVVYVSTNYQILKIADGQITVVAGDGHSRRPVIGALATASPFNYIYGLAVDRAGNLYIDDGDSSCVVRVDPVTHVLADAVGQCGSSGYPVAGPALSARLNEPRGIAVDRYGNLYITDQSEYKVFKVTSPTSSAATLSVLAGSGNGGAAPTSPIDPLSAALDGPYSVSVDQSLNVYIADRGWNEIAEIPGVPSAPDAPARLETLPGDGAVTLTFDTPGDDGGSPVTGYQYSIDGGLAWQTLVISGEPRHASTVSGLTSGTRYTFQVRAVNTVGAGTDATSSPVAPTAAHVAPVAIDPPAITGTDTVGHTLKCSHGTWADNPTSERYQWSRDGVIIHGATHETYKVETTDEGHDLSCTVTARDSAGAAHSTSSSIMVPVTNAAACPAPTGSLLGTVLGPVALGDRQEQVRARLARFDRYSYHTDNFCLDKGQGIRVGYASHALLGEAHMRPSLTGKIVLALTANRHYALDGVQPGTSLAAAAARLKLATPLRWGANTWYLVHGGVSTGVLKVHHGVILEVGIANRQLTDHHAAERQLLRSF